MRYGTLLSSLLLGALVGGCASSPSPEDFEGSETSSIEETPRLGAQDVDVVQVLSRRSPPVEMEVTALAVKPVDFVGKTIRGRARVDEVISDRGFYLGKGKDRVLGVVREDVPRREMIDIDEGDVLEFEGLLLTQGAKDDLTGELEADTKRALDQAPAFVAMYHRDVRIADVARSP